MFAQFKAIPLRGMYYKKSVRRETVTVESSVFLLMVMVMKMKMLMVIPMAKRANWMMEKVAGTSSFFCVM